MPLYARTEKRLKRKEREDELGITAIKDAMKENGELEEGSDSDNSDEEDEDDGGISGESSDEDNDVDEEDEDDEEEEDDDEEEGEEGAGDESASETGSDCKLSHTYVKCSTDIQHSLYQ
jgi:hypothetical protein